ncbi:UNVERIFIED_CONTAM: hypothetical protein H355_008601, partial [Colinus virginianus]
AGSGPQDLGPSQRTLDTRVQQDRTRGDRDHITDLQDHITDLIMDPITDLQDRTPEGRLHRRTLEDRLHRTLKLHLLHCCLPESARVFCRKEQLADYCLRRFSLDFKRGQDIAFHFNPRFKEDHKRVIVCNAMFHNSWGKEERTAPRFPFEPGAPFKLQVLCEGDHFKVAVNDAHLLQFNFREKKLNEITKLCIAGDITLTSVVTSMI